MRFWPATAASKAPLRTRTAAVASLALALAVGLGIPFITERVDADILASLGALTFSSILLQRMVGLFDLSRMSVPAAWWFGYVTMIFIPAHEVAKDSGLAHGGTYLLAVQSAMITVPLGIALVTLVTGFHRNEIRQFFDAPVVAATWERHVFAVYMLVLGVLLGFTMLYFIEAPVVPFLYILSNPGDSLELALLREQAFKLLESPLLFWYDVVRRVLYPFAIALALVYFLKLRRLTWLTALAVATAGGLVLGAATGAKMPVAAIALIAGFAWYLHRRGRISVVGTLGVALLVATFPVAVMLLSADDGLSVLYILRLLAVRMFYTNAEVLSGYFEVFPTELDFLGGRSIGKLSWLLGWESVDVENFVFRQIVGGPVDTGTATTAFLGNLWADFGWLGVLAGGMIAGVLMQQVQVWLTRNVKSPVILAAYASYLWCFAQLSLQSLAVTLLSGGALFLAAATWTMRGTGRVLCWSLAKR